MRAKAVTFLALVPLALAACDKSPNRSTDPVAEQRGVKSVVATEETPADKTARDEKEPELAPTTTPGYGDRRWAAAATASPFASAAPPGFHGGDGEKGVTGRGGPGWQGQAARVQAGEWVGSSRVDLQACKLEYSIVSPK